MKVSENAITQEAIEGAMDLFIGQAPTRGVDPVLWAARKALDYLNRRPAAAKKVLNDQLVIQRANAKLAAMQQDRETACSANLPLDEAAKKITGEDRPERAKHNLKRWLEFHLRYWQEWQQRSVTGWDSKGNELKLGQVVVSERPEAPDKTLATGEIGVAEWIREQGAVGISLWRTQQQTRAVRAIQDAANKPEATIIADRKKVSGKRDATIENAVTETVAAFFDRYSTCEVPGSLIQDLRESFKQEAAAFRTARAKADGAKAHLEKSQKKA